jgi:hypothetical protein
MSRKNQPTLSHDEATRTQIRSFIKAFIATPFQGRWQHILIDNPTKASAELFRFEHHYRDGRCRWIRHVAWQSLLDGELAGVSGLFFDGCGPAASLVGSQLSEKFSTCVDDSIWLINAGASALVFSHEGYGWHCVVQA